MARELTLDFLSQVTATQVKPFLMLEMLFDSGPLRLWTGYNTLTSMGSEWLGGGEALAVSTMSETANLTANGITFTLTGELAALIEIALAENYQNRFARVYLGFLGPYNEVITPYRAFSGRMDTMPIDEGGSTTTIALTIENVLADLERPRVRNYTPEDQALDNPADTIFKYVAALQDKQITWGRG